MASSHDCFRWAARRLLKKAPTKKAPQLEWCNFCKAFKPPAEPYTRTSSRCVACLERYKASLIPRDVNTMTREEIRESLSGVFWLRHNLWMTLFNHQRCGICNYPKELEMSDFERELRAAWESQGGCRTGVDPSLLEDMDRQDGQRETPEELMEKLIASWPENDLKNSYS